MTQDLDRGLSFKHQSTSQTIWNELSNQLSALFWNINWNVNSEREQQAWTANQRWCWHFIANGYSSDRNSFLCDNRKVKEANSNPFQLMDVAQVRHKWKEALFPSMISANRFRRIYPHLCKWVSNKWNIQTFAKILILNWNFYFRSQQISVKHDSFRWPANVITEAVIKLYEKQQMYRFCNFCLFYFFFEISTFKL